jgi:hypothetical protein
MEAWTFINKNNKEIIRCDLRIGDIEFGQEYYFTTCKYSPIWFVKTKEEAELAYKKFVHPQYSMNYTRPGTDKILLEDYDIVQFIANVKE